MILYYNMRTAFIARLGQTKYNVRYYKWISRNFFLGDLTRCQIIPNDTFRVMVKVKEGSVVYHMIVALKKSDKK